MAVSQWDYLEASVDLSKKSWKDSSGRDVRLRKGNTAPILAELGTEGWELTGTVPLDRASGAYRLYFKRQRAAEEPSNAEA